MLSLDMNVLSDILLYGFLGDNSNALSLVGILFIRETEENKKILVEYFDWFLFCKNKSNDTLLYPKDLSISRLLRNVQFQIARYKHSEQGFKIYQAWEKELSEADIHETMLFYSNILMAIKIKIPIKDIMKLICNFYNNYKMIDNNESPLEFQMENETLIEAMLGINISRIETLRDFKDYFDCLSLMDKNIRNNFLTLFSNDISYIYIILERVLCNERDKKQKNWMDTVSVLKNALKFSKIWKNGNLCSCITSFIGLIYHDDLKDFEQSIKILNKGKLDYPNTKNLFSEQLFDLYIFNKKYKKALKEISEVQELLHGNNNCFKPKYNILRKKGEVNAKLENWNESAINYINAASFAEKEKEFIEQANLLGDAGFAYWHDKNYEGMDSCLNHSLKILRPHYKGCSEVKALTSFRMISLVIRSIYHFVCNEPWKDDSIKPWVGICSKTGPNNKLLELDEVPLTAVFTLLCQIEDKLKLPFNALQHEVNRTDKGFVFNGVFVEFEIKQCFREYEFDDILKLGYDLIYFQELSNKMETINHKYWEKTEVEISNVTILNNNLFEEFLIFLMFSATLHMLQDDMYKTSFPIWKGVLKKYNNLSLLKSLNQLITYSEYPPDILLQILKGTDAIGKIIISIFLLKPPYNIEPLEMIQLMVYLYNYFKNKRFSYLSEKLLSYLISRYWSNTYLSPSLLKICSEIDSYKKIEMLLIECNFLYKCNFSEKYLDSFSINTK